MKTVLFALLVVQRTFVMSQDFEAFRTIYDNMATTFNHYARYTFPSQPTTWTEWTQPSATDTTPPINPMFDFIVVGSGSAGAVIANRLSEVPEWSVLLLEAGKGENQFSRIPLAAPIMSLTPYNWHYYMEYEPGISRGMNNNRMAWPRGKALGGTSVINYMIYTRGNKLDFDRWAAQGNPGWSYQEVLPYYIKSENATLRNGDYRYHGTGGYLGVEDIYQSKGVKAFVRSAKELGLKKIDYNANVDGLGFSTMQATVLQGSRHTVARAFLHPVKHRKNLRILTSAHVTKILIDPTTKEAYGVEYDHKGKKYRAGAGKEVVLSAGTFNSPQLLMLAGIGPKDHLKDLGIPLLKDLPVGRNLHDHLCFPGITFLINRDISLSIGNLASRETIVDYILNGTGPLTSLGGVEGIGYIKTELSRETADYPDIELIYVGATLATDYGHYTRKWMNIRDDVYDALFRPIENLPSWQIFPMLLHPKSRGFLQLRTTNPYDPPLLHGNFFTDPDQTDINTFLASIRFIQKLAKTKPFRKLGSTLNPNRIPGCEEHEFDSDDYWRCSLRSIAVTLHHQVGTAKMGPANDPGAVVDNELKVHGIGRLRVADCSVIPFATGAHTNAPAIMIGEKAADMIKSAWTKFS